MDGASPGHETGAGAASGDGVRWPSPARPAAAGETHAPPLQPLVPAPPDGPTPGPDAPPDGVPICEVVDGPTLGSLRVWTEAEWAELPEADRPATHAHCPGLGWVGVVPIACLN